MSPVSHFIWPSRFMQPPIQWVPGALSLGVKRPERQADHSPPSNAKVTNAWGYTSTPQYVFMVWCLVKHKDNFTFTLPICYSLWGALWTYMLIHLRTNTAHIKCLIYKLYTSSAHLGTQFIHFIHLYHEQWRIRLKFKRSVIYPKDYYYQVRWTHCDHGTACRVRKRPPDTENYGTCCKRTHG